ncbi:hypothetical protein [Listeria seeligeri]|uniref:hypothetical protein n=1 Tax=Listeria seeligeri TaxID=1640 RepID=UPI001629BCDC|nr:hypothetical protein [Listeria seeligeri]MBC1556995.1 hypothetical protein [Listeria seeligeri]HAB0718284.1 hypothetical protein [Listeria monocytogenes]
MAKLSKDEKIAQINAELEKFETQKKKLKEKQKELENEINLETGKYFIEKMNMKNISMQKRKKAIDEIAELDLFKNQ